MKAKELRQKTKEELMMMLRESREKLRQFKFDLAAKKLKNTNQLKFLKRQIAQLLTILRE